MESRKKVTKMITVERNSDTEKYEILSDGAPMLTPAGKRMDGGGHDMKDKAERQAGYIKTGEEKKAKREAEEAKGVVQE